MKQFDGLSEAQILQGIEDLCAEKLGWDSAVVVLPNGIIGMIIGHKHFVDMMRTAAEGKTNTNRDDLN